MTDSELPGGDPPDAGPGGTSDDGRRLAADAFSQAETSWREGRFADAVSQYATALAHSPANIEARIGHARALELSGDRDGGLRSLDVAITGAPDQTEFLVVRGAMRGRQKDFVDAESDLRRVLKLHPAHAPALHELGIVLMHRGLVTDAAELLRRASALQPDRPGLQVALGDALNRAGELPAAAEALAKATERDPENRRAWHIYGRVLDRLNRPDEAAHAYRRAQGLEL